MALAAGSVQRDTEGTKKLTPGKWRDETVEYLKDNNWIWTEKIDGTNIGVVWDGHNVSFQGRMEKSEIPKPLMDKLNNLFGGNENEELFEQKFGEMEVILFGEGYGKGIQKRGKQYRDDISFILFDVFIPNDNLWMRRDSVEDIAKTFNIDVVPIVGNGSLEQAIEYIKTQPNSTIGTAKMEGVVCRPRIEMKDRRNKRVIVKIKVEDFCTK